jgi:hypothetical protein
LHARHHKSRCVRGFRQCEAVRGSERLGTYTSARVPSLHPALTLPLNPPGRAPRLAYSAAQLDKAWYLANLDSATAERSIMFSVSKG